MIRTKIIVTLGPATAGEHEIRKIILGGVDIIRINFSHGSQEEHLAHLLTIRKLNSELNGNISVMQDLEGYRIRTGSLKDKIHLKENERVYLVPGSEAENGKDIPIDYKGGITGIGADSYVYVDDGKIKLKVLGKKGRRLAVKVITGGELTSNKGVNITGARLKFPPLTDEDRKNADLAAEHKFDFIAQSFVRKAGDIKLLKSLVLEKHPGCKVFAKIEHEEALINIDGIIKESDGLIIARGDLGVCLPIYKLPVIQKEIIKKCLAANKEVVVATQMLESMTYNTIPTRAEVSDVANAILDGATHLLLSGETAVGKYPLKTVSMMKKIIKNTEQYMKNKNKKIFY